MNRRSLLHAAPAAIAATALPVVTAARADDHHPDAELFRLERDHIAAWGVAHKAWNEAGDDDEELIEPSRLSTIADEIGQRIADLPAQTFEGCQAKARSYVRSDQFFWTGECVEQDLLLALVTDVINARLS